MFCLAGEFSKWDDQELKNGEKPMEMKTNPDGTTEVCVRFD